MLGVWKGGLTVPQYDSFITLSSFPEPVTTEAATTTTEAATTTTEAATTTTESPPTQPLVTTTDLEESTFSSGSGSAPPTSSTEAESSTRTEVDSTLQATTEERTAMDITDTASSPPSAQQDAKTKSPTSEPSELTITVGVVTPHPPAGQGTRVFMMKVLIPLGLAVVSIIAFICCVVLHYSVSK